MSHTHLQTEQITEVPKVLVTTMVTQALAEDIDQGDINALLINEHEQARARVITREPMVMCGYDWVDEVFRQVDPNLKIHWYHHDGDEVFANKTLFEVEGLARSILSAERNALNFLQMLSAVATKTREYVKAIKGTECTILDTRKTIPGFRLAQKYAVTCGGGMNHRIGLFDAFLIKENHIAACDHSITRAIEKAREIAPQKMVEVEVENFDELNEALKAHADVIMLDNFSLRDMQKAVSIAKGKAQLEASGNMSLDSIYAVAQTGVDFISIGALTKNIQAIDLSMRFI
ncbi:carboxylating nicotinate-nucleotide diphosphorylase [Cysteiniphilum sp. QT6929]|uniref:carboxylating nicotinate-nucleotide diphosphorylase n=1 Tax=Cysteiniphilum sp. QT6929 TaxID=2975055 RepID=UPI0024B3867A|nr:carboxylating nicotinate-nucleotide diphosphorylase [Cysteiniphilum sp. QT6929]WHN66056.1 carboxylating nicotinate-nucleotide diphosphorylase [Cysteiniphilum sp. QT6929]